MLDPLPAGIQRSLKRLRAAGAPVHVSEVAQRLMALEGPVATPLARRIVAAALGHPADDLPECLGDRHLRPAVETAVADVPLSRAAFVVVDLETTGLSADTDSIIEIGAVRVEALACGDRFETLVRPPGPGPLSRTIVALTGIEDGMLLDAPPAGRALRRFGDWLARTPTAPFVAHNAGFDARFTKRSLEAEGLPPLRIPVLCTQKLGRRLVPRLGRYNLDHLSAHFGVTNRARHRALGDAEAAARVLVELLRIALEEERASTVGELLDLQAKPTRRRRRRRR